MGKQGHGGGARNDRPVASDMNTGRESVTISKRGGQTACWNAASHTSLAARNNLHASCNLYGVTPAYRLMPSKASKEWNLEHCAGASSGRQRLMQTSSRSVVAA